MQLIVFYVTGSVDAVSYVVTATNTLDVHTYDVADTDTHTVADIQKYVGMATSKTGFLQKLRKLASSWKAGVAHHNQVMCRFVHAQFPSNVYCVVYQVGKSSSSVHDISEELWLKSTDATTCSNGLLQLLRANTKASFELFFTPVQVAVAFGSTLMLGIGAWSLLALDKNRRIARAYLTHQQHLKKNDKKKEFEQRRRQAKVMLEDISLLASHDR